MATANFTVTINQKEAVQLLGGFVPATLNKKIVDGIKDAAVTPKGTKAAIISKGRTRRPATSTQTADALST